MACLAGRGVCQGHLTSRTRKLLKKIDNLARFKLTASGIANFPVPEVRESFFLELEWRSTSLAKPSTRRAATSGRRPGNSFSSCAASMSMPTTTSKSPSSGTPSASLNICLPVGRERRPARANPGRSPLSERQAQATHPHPCAGNHSERGPRASIRRRGRHRRRHGRVPDCRLINPSALP